MPDQSREAMPDIISAKCFGCGHVVKVPAALGGKKARCPKCTNTISIPSLSDTSEDIVGDDMLPEVAREDVVQGEWIEEEKSSEEPSPPGGSRRSGAVPRRGMSSSSNPRMSGGRQTGKRGGPAPAKKTSPGLVIGIVVGVLVLVILIAMAAGNKSGPKGKSGAGAGGGAKSTAASQPQVNPEDSHLEGRCMDFVRAVNSGDVERIMKFYAYEPDDERATRRGVFRMIEQGPKLDGAGVKSASAASGTATITYTGGEKTLTWKKVGEIWMIAEKP
jgi:hypothetical protein